MRKIVFRAWDIINKKYYYNVQDVYDEEIGDSFQDILDNEKLIVEQDTGLKDVNGVEIYENDVVYIPLNQASYLNNTRAKVSYSEHAELLAGNIMLSRVYQCIEVIGNIHEQPELLEETK